MSARIVAQQWVSLDGFAAGRSGEAEIFAAVSAQADQASMEYNAALIPTVTEVLLGRRTYEAFAEVWPTADLPVAEQVNTTSKVVFSRSLEQAPWGRFPPARLEKDAVSYLTDRRDQADGVLLLWGSVNLMASLLRAGLLDELDLFVAPVVLGAGTRLFPEQVPLNLELVESHTWSSVAHLRYRRAGAARA